MSSYTRWHPAAPFMLQFKEANYVYDTSLPFQRIPSIGSTNRVQNIGLVTQYSNTETAQRENKQINLKAKKQ